jgi:hypothetical protein
MKEFSMLNVIALRPAAKTQAADHAPKHHSEVQRSHVLNRLIQEKSGRLYCSDDVDFHIPELEIYAAR